MKFSPLLDEMMKALQVLPGVGPKSAQRMAFTLLERERSGGLRLAQLLSRALTEIGHCSHCRTFTENERCGSAPIPSAKRTACCAWWRARRTWPPSSRPASSPAATSC